MYAENIGASFADALVAAAEGKVPMLNSRSAKAISGFVELLDDLRAVSATTSASWWRPC
ncbi:ATP-dependent helicase PcrA domain protein [Mycobacterium xenopi 3993]|nr:ATP-dependent helicase PcrA domain protein [Mycobacterium xenopi 3993]